MEKIKVLLVEGIHPIAKTRLEEESYHVDLISHAPDEKELVEKLKGYNVLGIRSKTEVTKKVLEESKHLIGIGAFCIGTNQIQLSYAKSIGVPVFNAMVTSAVSCLFWLNRWE
jgi:D-3-phosphoglycerate dehydrogenase